MKILQNYANDIRINIKIPFDYRNLNSKQSFKEILAFSGGECMEKITQITPLSKIKEDIYEKNEFLLET